MYSVKNVSSRLILVGIGLSVAALGCTNGLFNGFDVSSVTVSKIYPLNGSNWMDYVTVSNPTLDDESQPDLPCAGTEVGYHGCLHGAEKLAVNISGYSSCSGLFATDALGAFNWGCKPTSGGLMFFTVSLQKGKGLVNLISSNGSWLPNSVSVFYQGNLIGLSQSGVWWNNPIQPLSVNPTAVTSVTVSGTIYYSNASMIHYGINLSGNKIGLVFLPGAVATLVAAAGNNCNSTNGLTTSPTAVTVICTGGMFNWIEGAYNAAGVLGSSVYSLALFGGKFDTLNMVSATGAQNSQIYSSATSNSRFQSIQTQGGTTPFFVYSGSGNLIKYVRTWAGNNASTAGLYFSGSNSNLADDIFSTDNAGSGILIASSSSNVIARANTSDNAMDGVQLTASTAQFLTSIISSGNGSNGINLASASNTNDLNDVTVVNNVNGGISDTSASNTYNNILSMNNTYGLYLASSTDVLFDVVSSYNSLYGLYLNTATNNKFVGYLTSVGNGSSPCNVISGTAPGLINSTCTTTGVEGSSTYTGQNSTAIFHTAVNSVSSLVGKAFLDTANTSNAGGAQTFGSITDWTGFQNGFRSWGSEGLAFPSSTNQGNCTVGTCRIWDFRLSILDTALLNHSGNGISPNSTFYPGGTCPAEASGSIVISDLQASPHSYLQNAVEIVDAPAINPKGNNNGLCETGETCLYTPNIGAYQGEGALTPSCNFINGGISGVILTSFPFNGG